MLGTCGQLQIGIVKDIYYELTGGILFIFQESPYKNFNCILSTYTNYRQALSRILIMNLLEEFYLYFKNYLTRTLIVYQAFIANYKQALSRIPIINSLKELYLYFKNHFVKTSIAYQAFITNYRQALLSSDLFGLEWRRFDVKRRWSASLYLLIIGLVLS